MSPKITFTKKSTLRALALSSGVLLAAVAGYSYMNTHKAATEVETTVTLKEKHADFLENHPFNERMKLTKKERIANGLPPNKYMEEEFLLTANPELGRPTPENLIEIQKELAQNASLRAAPGAATNSWIERGPTNVGGRTRAVMFAPGSTTEVFAGGVSGGLWKNSNITSAATTWTQVSGVPAHLNVTCITVDPNNSSTMYLGTGEVYTGDASGNGVYRSTDGGDNWVSVYAGGAAVADKVAFIQDIIAWNNPVTSATEVFVAVGSTAYGDPGAAGPGYVFPGSNAIGLYRSTDGTSYTRLTDAILQNGTRPRSPNNFDVDADGNLWMGTRRSVFGAGGGRIYSNDGSGWSFEGDLGTESRVELACSKTTSNKIYALAENRATRKPKIFLTTNGFATNTELPLPNDVDNGIPADDFTRGQSFYDLLLGVDPNNDNVVYVGGIDLFKSTNSGSTWSQISKWSNNNNLAALAVPLVHADQHGITFADGSSTTILFGNDGGVFYSPDAGTSIDARNSGYNVTQFYKGGINQSTTSDKLVAGAQDNGVQFINGAPLAPAASSEISGGDGCWVFIDKQDEFIITSYVYNSFYFHNINGGLVATIDNDQNTGSFVNQAGLDSDANILYTNGTSGTDYQINRYAITNTGTGASTKTVLDNAIIDNKPTFFVASPFTNNRMLVGTAVGTLIRMDNANATPTWTDIGFGSFSGSISDIRYGETEDDIMVTFHNYGVTNIWFTENGGTTWVSKEGNLPDLPVKAILQNPIDRDEVVIGTYLGVWKTNDWSAASPTWTQSQNGMSDVKVTSFDFRDADNTIMVATYGRGMFTGKFESSVEICASSGTTATDKGITNVTIGTINNSDGPTKDNGYEDFTAQSTAAVRGATCDLSVSVNTDGNNTMYTRVWIDWNGNKDFTDAGEEYDLGTATNVTDDLTSASAFSLTIPATATLGSHRMRVSTKDGSAPTSCETGFDGEVEDYIISVTDYCGSSSSNVNFEYISNVTVEAINNNSTGSLGGYSDFTAIQTDLEIGSIPTISVAKTWTGTVYNEAVSVWIDYNKDGDFDDANERVFTSPSSQITPVSGPFATAIPVDAKLGATRMRVGMRDLGVGVEQTNPCDNYTYGEVEDYTVNIVPASACSQTQEWNGTWSAGGAPTATEKAMFTANYNTTTADINACEMEIAAGVTVTITAASYAKVEGDIIVNGTLIIEHEGSLVQVDDAATVTKGAMGVIEVRKTTPTLAPLGFMFMSSPMDAETKDGVYGSAFRVIEVKAENFTVDPVLEAYAPYAGAEIFLGPNNSFLGNYVSTETLVPGDGLVVYPQASITAGNSTYDMTYTKGTLNNGQILYPVQYNGQTKNNFNLIGNPYPSAIDVNALINDNNMISEVYFWNHITGPNNSLPGYLGNNYSMNDISIRNLSGGTASGNGGAAPGRFMSSGQGVAIKAIQGGDANVSFTNSMRVTDNNDQYRSSQREDRLWLNLKNEDFNLSSNTLIAFLPQATDGIDPGYDSRRIATTAAIFTTLKNGDELGIQALGSFDESMQIATGFSTAIEERLTYTISIDNLEGEQITNAPVYLVDFVNETYVNLKENDYSFSSTLAAQPNRFMIAFEIPEILGIEAANVLDTTISLYPNPANDVVNLTNNGQELMTKITVVGLNGQIIRSMNVENNDQNVRIDVSQMNAGVYFIQIEGTSSQTVKKLIVR